MPDIALCRSKQCPRRLECYRYMAVPKEPHQAYQWRDHKDCESFWVIKPGMLVREEFGVEV